MDNGPGPVSIRKAQHDSCANSERISCNTAQNPICGGTGGNGSGDVPRYNGIFVDAIATIISMMNGMVTHRVSQPPSISNPPMISNQPSAVAMKCGNGKPSFVKRPTP